MNLWPQVSVLLQRRYLELRRAHLEEAAKHNPNITPWPQRRSRKRKPIPGLYEVFDLEG